MIRRLTIPICLLLGWLFFIQSQAQAAYQACTLGENCTVGEFLYDDDYEVITTGYTCTLTSKDPSGNSYLSQTLTPTADGWYAHTFDTTGATQGQYRGQVCCINDTTLEKICLDKTFTISESSSLTATDVENAVLDAQTSDHTTTGSVGEAIGAAAAGSSLTPADIWTYNNRSLTDFGSLVSNIWNSNTRTLTSFGDLISNFWTYTSRTITNQGDIVTESDITNIATKTDIQNITVGTSSTTINNISASLTTINNELREQRELLESVANKPIVETDFEVNFDLQSKLKETNTNIDSLNDSAQTLAEKTTYLTDNWSRLNSDEVVSQIDAILVLLGSTSDKKDSLSANVSWLADAWDNQLTKDLINQTEILTTTLTDLRSRTNFYGKNQTTPNLNKLSAATENLNTLIGQETDKPSKTTLYGFAKYLNELNQNLLAEQQKLNDLRADWAKSDPSTLDRNLAQIRNRLNNFKLIPEPQVLGATTNSDPAVQRKNELFSLKAFIETSKAILGQFSGKPIQYIWLEEGSIVFKAVVTNPSSIISQTVPLKFYLPVEIKKEHIIELDEDLTLNYDIEREAYYVQGEFNLAPEETRTFKIEVTDVWLIDPELIESYRNQANQLLEPLKGTAYYGQGATVKADIDVTLDQILSKTQTFQTPEERIRNYREAQIELTGVEQKLVILQQLVGSASGTGSIFGFIGGVQAIAVWGLIIIVITAFVYLSLYMRALNLQLDRSRPQGSRPVTPPSLLELIGNLTKRSRGNKLASLVLFLLLSASASAFIGSIFLKLRVPKATAENPVVKVAAQNEKTNTTTNPPPLPTTTTTKVLGEKNQQISYFIVKVTATKPTNIYQLPDSSSPVTSSLSESQVVSRLDEKGDWSKIEFLAAEELQQGWLKSSLLTPEPSLQ